MTVQVPPWYIGWLYSLEEALWFLEDHFWAMVRRLASFICFYLSETVDNLTDFDVLHLASNMMRELDIRTKGVWTVSKEELKDFIIPP